MTVLDVKQGYLLRFFCGEEIVGGLTAFARERKIQAAWVQALGALTSAELGYYDLAAHAYLKQRIEEEVEIASLVGNLSRLEDDIIAHLHATLGRRDFSTLGGHLFEGVAGATVEVAVMNFPGVRLERARDEEIGLNLWKLPQTFAPAP